MLTPYMASFFQPWGPTTLTTKYNFFFQPSYDVEEGIFATCIPVEIHTIKIQRTYAAQLISN